MDVTGEVWKIMKNIIQLYLIIQLKHRRTTKENIKLLGIQNKIKTRKIAF